MFGPPEPSSIVQDSEFLLAEGAAEVIGRAKDYAGLAGAQGVAELGLPLDAVLEALAVGKQDLFHREAGWLTEGPVQGGQ
jgi:hypothetical protein